MQLLREYLRKEMPLLQKNNIRMRFLGRIEELPAGVQNDVRDAMEKTAGNEGMVLCVALNYGGRAEIVDALNAILAERNGHGAQDKSDRSAAFKPLVYGWLARSRFADPHKRRNACQQFPTLADCLCGDFRDRNASGRISIERACLSLCSSFKSGSAAMAASAKTNHPRRSLCARGSLMRIPRGRNL